MTRIADTIPNMINGVSQQPANLRLPTQGVDCENAFCSVVEGLSKRPPSKHEGTLPGLNLSGKAHLHDIDRGDAEKYLVEITNGDLKVFDLAGNPQVVNFPQGKAYLTNADPERRFDTMTVADYTIIVNKDVVTAMDATSAAPSLADRAVFWFKQGAYRTKYEMNVGGLISGYSTPGAESFVDSFWIATDKIAEVVYSHTGHRASSTDALVGQSVASYGGSYTSGISGSVIFVQTSGGGLGQVTVSDGIGNSALKLIYKTIKTLADLPEVCVNGHQIEVTGSDGALSDNYWLNFEMNGPGTIGNGKWVEAVAPGVLQRFNASTMPHQLVREANGTFTFQASTWDERAAGDDETNPVPSFIGQKITSSFFNLNRLGFLSEQNVIMSTAGEFFNFFRPTATTTLDTDPIDIAVTHTKVATLKAAIPANKKLILFSDHTQFVLDTQGQPLTLDNISIPPITEFENTPEKVTPVSNGNFVYFATESGNNTGILEYFIADENAAAPSDAANITAHVPSYIPAGATHIASSSNDDILTVLTDGEPSSMFMYQFYWAGREKLQSAWHKWSFDSAIIRHSFFIGSRLYVVLQRGSVMTLESVEVSEGQRDAPLPFLVHLDRRVEEAQCTVTYDPGTGNTTVTLPYATTAPVEMVLRAGTPVGTVNQVVKHTRPSNSQLSIKGNYSNALFYVGLPYRFRYRLSTVVVREDASGGGRTVIADGRLQLKTMTLIYDESAGFTVEVTPLYRDTNVHKYTGRTIGDGENIIGQIAPDSGEFSFVVMSKNDQVTIDIINDTFLPSRFLSAEWTGDLTLRNKRI